MDKKKYRDKFNIEGRVAIVTGGVGILGRHFCSGLAEAGTKVAVVDLSQKAASEFAEYLHDQYHVPSIGLACDVRNEHAVKSMIGEVTERLGPVQILANNAAGKSSDLEAFFAPFEEYSLEQWREIMSINIDGMFIVAREAGKNMLQHNLGGSIIQTASIYGVLAPDQRIYAGSEYLGREINTPAVYTVSKSAVIGLTKYLATYWAPKGIRVNSISPGGVESGQNETFVKNYSQRIPMGRMAKDCEIVGALLFLASDASSYITGQNIIIDGGLSAW